MQKRLFCLFIAMCLLRIVWRCICSTGALLRSPDYQEKPLSPSTYGLKVLDTNGTSLLFSSNESFSALGSKLLTTGGVTKSVSVPINFGPYPTTSSVWVLCNTGLSISQWVYTGGTVNSNLLELGVKERKQHYL